MLGVFVRASMLVALLAATMAADCGGGSACSDCTDAGALLPYRYVAIQDLEPNDTAGVDLDAVALVKSGQTFYADVVHECLQGPGIEIIDGPALNCDNAVGPPDNAAGECQSSDDFFTNLGGLGGSIILSFDFREIDTGDIIQVFECGAIPDEYSISVGTGTVISDASWVVCTSSASGLATCTVPELPDVPAN